MHQSHPVSRLVGWLEDGARIADVDADLALIWLWRSDAIEESESWDPASGGIDNEITIQLMRRAPVVLIANPATASLLRDGISSTNTRTRAAVVLGQLLAKRVKSSDPLDGLGRDFLAAIQETLDAPWSVAVSDFVYPHTTGERPPDFAQRLNIRRLSCA